MYNFRGQGDGAMVDRILQHNGDPMLLNHAGYAAHTIAANKGRAV